MQGHSLLGNDHRQFVFSEAQFGSQTNSKIGYMLRSDSYKLLVYGSMQDCVFYDLKKDPFELHDVSKEPDYQETLHRYQTALSEFCPVPCTRKSTSRHKSAAAAESGSFKQTS